MSEAVSAVWTEALPTVFAEWIEVVKTVLPGWAEAWTAGWAEALQTCSSRWFAASESCYCFVMAKRMKPPEQALAPLLLAWRSSRNLP